MPSAFWPSGERNSRFSPETTSERESFVHPHLIQGGVSEVSIRFLLRSFNTAELAESRRKMQARRRMKNRIALTLSMATMIFGLFWLVWILMATITRGIDGMSLALFTEMTPPPNTAGGGLANALAGSGLLYRGRSDHV